MHASRIHRFLLVLSALSLLLVAGLAAAGDGHDHGAAAAFDRLKALAGTWHGQTQVAEDTEMAITHVFRVSANGTVVQETMNPDHPDHEMINMYHLDGDDLVLTHYCAGNNQPTMKLVEASAKELRFDFTGGTNLDPATDGHIHAARLVLVDADTLESSWTSYNEGKEAGVMTFNLKRSE